MLVVSQAHCCVACVTAGMFQARLWVQIMRELRQGVRLRKVEHVQLTPLEYELTPFEVLLEDIRLHRFKLNRIMVRNVTCLLVFHSWKLGDPASL